MPTQRKREKPRISSRIRQTKASFEVAGSASCGLRRYSSAYPSVHTRERRPGGPAGRPVATVLFCLFAFVSRHQLSIQGCNLGCRAMSPAQTRARPRNSARITTLASARRTVPAACGLLEREGPWPLK
jgi:hypothetical protein